MKRHLVRLDRVANEMNAWLLAIVIGLGMLDLTVLVAKTLPAFPATPVATDTAASASAAAPLPAPRPAGSPR